MKNDQPRTGTRHSVTTATDTCSTATSSSNTTLDDVNLNAIHVFESTGLSPIPTDIHLVGLDNDSVDEFDTVDQSPVYNTDDQHPEHLGYEDSPSPIADSYNWTNNDIDDDCALIDTGAMVTCTGTKHIIHNFKTYTKLK